MELILVMAILATLMAVVAPTISRSMRGRHLDQEAKRFVALTEYGRQEAMSLGVPMLVWVDAAGGRFGVIPKAGFSIPKQREREFTLDPEVRFEIAETRNVQGIELAVQFEPNGTPDAASVPSFQLVSRSEEKLTVAKTADGWGYEIVKETR